MADLQKYKDTLNLVCRLLLETKHYLVQCLDLYETGPNLYRDEDKHFIMDYGKETGKAYRARIKFPDGRIKTLRIWELYFTNPDTIPWTGCKMFYYDERINSLPLEQKVVISLAWFLYCEGTGGPEED